MVKQLNIINIVSPVLIIINVFFLVLFSYILIGSNLIDLMNRGDFYGGTNSELAGTIAIIIIFPTVIAMNVHCFYQLIRFNKNNLIIPVLTTFFLFVVFVLPSLFVRNNWAG